MNRRKIFYNKINLNNNIFFMAVWLIFSIIFVFLENYSYYNNKKIADYIEIKNLAKNIHLRYYESLSKGETESIYVDHINHYLEEMKPYGIVKLSKGDILLVNYYGIKNTMIERDLIKIPKNLTNIKNSPYELYIAKHSNPKSIFVTVFNSMTFSITDFYKKSQQTNFKEAISWYKEKHLFLRTKKPLSWMVLIFIVLAIIRWRQKPLEGIYLKEHNPQKLVKILTNFREDTPIKYTTHLWDMNFKKEYGDFDGYISKVKEQWLKIEVELMELSPRLHTKIYNFLFNSDDTICIGWSSLKGLKEWCNEGNEPFYFRLEKPYKVQNKTISTFEDIINIFKQEIQIRNENNILENIFIDIEEKLDDESEGVFGIETIKLKGKSFYTDVETFKSVLNRIFSEIKKRKEFNEIKVEAVEYDNESYIDLKIIQIGSQSNRSSKDMLNIADGGDSDEIKKALTHLCDWSIESSNEDENYRINYLRDDSVREVEILDDKPIGFTHIMRFYR